MYNLNILGILVIIYLTLAGIILYLTIPGIINPYKELGEIHGKISTEISSPEDSSGGRSGQCRRTGDC
jgi:hypothetical protein